MTVQHVGDLKKFLLKLNAEKCSNINLAFLDLDLVEKTLNEMLQAASSNSTLDTEGPVFNATLQDGVVYLVLTCEVIQPTSSFVEHHAYMAEIKL